MPEVLFQVGWLITKMVSAMLWMIAKKLQNSWKRCLEIMHLTEPVID